MESRIKSESKDKGEELTEVNKIFRTLMHFPGSAFTDLWDKSVESNKFTYYLKKLEGEGLVEKRDGKYFLTIKGKAEASTISGETGKNIKKPFVALLLVPKNKGKFILYRRMKEPHYGKVGFPGAKVEFGEEILSAAKRELLEETGLVGDGRILTVQNVLIVNDGEIFAHFTQFVVVFDNPKGDLIKSSREGTYEWASKEDILAEKNLFPDIRETIKDVEKNEFSIKEVKLIQSKEAFAGMEVKKVYPEK